jgi:hypothetical protein
MATMLDSRKGPDHWYEVRVKPHHEVPTAPWRWVSPRYLLIQTDLPPPVCA